MSDFKTFMSLTDASIANEITAILKANDIAFKTQDTSKDFDPSMANNEAAHSQLIMLDPKDFEKASAILEQNTTFHVDEIDPQHPLFSFSAEELKDVVKNYDEWHPADVKLARHLLNEQNIVVEQTEVREQQQRKELKLYDEEKSSSLTLWMGYLFCIMGGLAGIGIAIFLLTAKKTLPDGSKKHIYAAPDRAHGFYMLLMGGIIFTLLLSKY